MDSVRNTWFAPPSTSPFPWGTSPFRQKGHGFLGDFAFFDKAVPGGTAAVLRAIPAGPLRTFAQQKFRGSEWYDAYAVAAVHAVAASLCRQPFEPFRTQTGSFHAEAAGTMYRALLKVVSNENVALWGPRVASVYFEFGRVQTRVLGPKQVAGTWSGLPAGLVQFTLYAAVGFTERTLALAGARLPKVEVGPVEPDGEGHGQPLHRVAFRIVWA